MRSDHRAAAKDETPTAVNACKKNFVCENSVCTLTPFESQQVMNLRPTQMMLRTNHLGTSALHCPN
jgi:hypothetical protein